MGHRETAKQDLIGLDVHQNAAPGFVRPPPAGCISLTQRCYVLRAAFDHREAIEVTAIFGSIGADERRAPTRIKTMLGIKRAKTAETGVDQPQFILCIPAKLVNIDVASDVDAARNVTCVVLAGRLQFLRHGRHVVVFPDRVAATDG